MCPSQPLIPRFAAAISLACLLAGCASQRGGFARGFDPDSIPDAYARPTAALMWPGATRAFHVTPEGNLYNGDWMTLIRPACGGIEAAPPRRIASEARWRPVLRWRRVSAPIEWDFEAVALPEPAPRDSGLLVSLEVTATNRGDTRARCSLAFDLAVPDTAPLFLAFDADDDAGPLRWGPGAEKQPVHAFAPGRARGPRLEREWTLAPAAVARMRVVLPAYATPATALTRWARMPHAQRVDESRRFWTAEVERGARLELGDPEAEDAWRAALVVLLACRERRGPQWVPVGGPFHYRDVWLRDGARATAALSMAGFTAESRQLATGLAQLGWPQGAFLTQRGQLDGTGEVLWALEQALLRPAPDAAVGVHAEAALRAWRWFEWQRDRGRAERWSYGLLMPFSDPRDNELTRTRLVGTDAWAIAGYRAAARLLAAAGREADAARVLKSRDLYVADFRDALRRSPGDVPACWQGEGRDWGNLSVVYPCGAIPSSDPRVAALAKRVWTEVGGAGLCAYAHRDSLHYYVGADLGVWAMLAGRESAADSVLAALLHWRTASGTAAEVFAVSGEYGRNPPPHPTSAAALVALMRSALVYDDDDTLRLTMGARPRWWQGGRVSGAPTRWGTLDLSFRRHGDSVEWTWTPVPVWTALTLPPGTRLAAAVAPPLLATPAANVVLAPPGVAHARVRATASGAGAS